MEDNQIVDLYLQRDESAIRQTKEKYGRRLYVLAYGIVKDVQYADQTAAELGGKADALRFAAGQGGTYAVKGEVVQADIAEEAQAAADLFKHLSGNLSFFVVELECIDEFPGFGDTQSVEFSDIQTACFDGERNRIEPFAVTFRADLRALV